MSQAPGPTSPLNSECDIGPFHWPPKAGTGSVKVKIKTAIDVEVQKPNGKDPVRSKVKGKKPASVELLFTWSRSVELEGDAIRIAVDPHGENSGKAWEFRNPEANKRNVNAILIKDAGDLVINGDSFSFTASADGWNEPVKASVGGTTTPKTSVPAKPNINIGGPPSNIRFGLDEPPPGAAGLPLGEIQPTGFDSPLAPDAKP